MKNTIFAIAAICAAITPAFAGSRVTRSINEAWTFTQEGKTETVNVPHSWNTLDVKDEEPGFYRGVCTYEKTVTINEDPALQEVFAHFEGANTVAELYVNGKSVGRHIGGYTAFCWNITDYVHKGENKFLVKVDNRHNVEIAPLSADFAFYGGLYRDVNLVFTSPQHISLTHFASNGVYLTTPTVSEAESTVHVRTMLSNDTAPVKGYILQQSIYDAEGILVASAQKKLKKLPSGENQEILQDLKVKGTKLWDVESPYLYKVVTTLKDARGNELDSVENPLGFRTFSFDKDSGLTLNGRHVKLMGTNRHQDYIGLANALPDEMHVRDVRMLKEMGSNYLRISHYPQDPIVPSLCDAYGIITSIEIPAVNEITVDCPAFDENCLSQLRDMIYQNFNHPSVLIWAYMNEIIHHRPFPKTAPEEVQQAYHDAIGRLAWKLDDECKALDPSRYTMIVICGDPYERYFKARVHEKADIMGVNIYSGWYDGYFDYLLKSLDHMRRLFPDSPILLTEYGAGVDPRIHTLKPLQFDYSAEWGRMFHSAYIKNVESLPWLIGSAVWNFNDFFAENRVDAVPHVNNKGIVGVDRVKKNSYNLYKAHLTKEPFVALSDKDWTLRGGNEGQCNRVEVYSNATEVTLSLNGKVLGTKSIDANLAVWDDVVFKDGANYLSVKASNGAEDGLAIDYQAVPKDLGKFREINVNIGSYCCFEDRIAGAIWIPEQEYTPGSWGYVGGRKYNRWYWNKEFRPMSDRDILGTENDPIFQTQREEIQSFKADVPDGQYFIYLYFAELAFNPDGTPLKHIFEGDHTDTYEQERQFNVSINGNRVLTDFNMMKELGANRSCVKKFTVNVVGGKGLSVDFDAVKGMTALNAIRIFRKL